MISLLVLGVLFGFALAGALLVVFSREVLRLALGLGVLLLVVAGIFLYFDAAFLAIAQVFVYAGGVLVLLLFALMLLKRDTAGRLVLKHDHDVGAAVVSVAVFVLIGVGYGSLAPKRVPTELPIEAMASALLGPYLPQFEAVALLLLVTLVGAIAIVATRRSAPEPSAVSEDAVGVGEDAEACRTRAGESA